MRVNELCCKDDDSNSVACDRCGSKESSCKCGRPCRPDHEVLVNKVVCSKQVDIVAETIIALSSLGITLPPRATTLPPITVTPDRLGIVQNSIILKDEVTTTGYIPATITVSGLPTTVTANLPFQQHTPCPSACPEDILSVAPLEVEGIIAGSVRRFRKVRIICSYLAYYDYRD